MQIKEIAQLEKSVYFSQRFSTEAVRTGVVLGGDDLAAVGESHGLVLLLVAAVAALALLGVAPLDTAGTEIEGGTFGNKGFGG